MRQAILSVALLLSSLAWSGCSGSGDGAGAGGAGGAGATGGVGGPASALSLDADTALPAMGGASTAIELASGFGNTVSSILEAIALLPPAAVPGAVPKAAFDFSGFCASGAASLDAPSWPPETWVPPTDITLTLAECAGSVLAAGPVSGSIVWSIESVSADSPSGLSIEGAANVMLLISTSPDTRADVTGAFEVFTMVSDGFVGSGGSEGDGAISFRLGSQLDEDLITIAEVGQEAGQAMRLGCFDIHLFVSRMEPSQIAPLGAIDLASQVYTMNDYSQTPPSIVFDENEVPSTGELSLFSGDRSDAGEARSEPCFEASDGDSSKVTATFFEGGCIDLGGIDAQGQPFQTSTTWDKLLAGDFTEAPNGACGSGMPCGEVPTGAFVIADSDFLDSNWAAEALTTPGAMVEWPVVRETSDGLGNSPYRDMTHSIGPATDCGVSCTLFVTHERLGATYNPSLEGAISYIDYSEAQRLIMSEFEGGAVDWTFAVIQRGRPWNFFTETRQFANLDWATSGLCGLTAEDFGSPGNHPDFSASGTEMTFAYVRTNANTSETDTLTSVHGIDDFKVVIVGE